MTTHKPTQTYGRLVTASAVTLLGLIAGAASTGWADEDSGRQPNGREVSQSHQGDCTCLQCGFKNSIGGFQLRPKRTQFQPSPAVQPYVANYPAYAPAGGVVQPVAYWAGPGYGGGYGGGAYNGTGGYGSGGADASGSGQAYSGDGAPTPSDPGTSGVPDFGDFSSGLSAAGSSASAGAAAGYIDPARIASRIRFRYDNMLGANAPTRAEFLYPTIGTRGGFGPQFGIGGGFGLSDFDFEELGLYAELAFGPRLSFFGEAPMRRVSPLDLDANDGVTNDPQASQVGIGDLKAGVRLGILADDYQALTFQMTFIGPFGDARRALGLGHSSIDVAFLYQADLIDDLTFYAELHDWQTLDAATLDNNNGDFEGWTLDSNVVRFGAGLGLHVWRDCCGDRRLTFLYEVVGWNVIAGLQTELADNTTEPRNANGDTIVNGKYGVRYTSGPNSVYFGYGHNYTTALWYSDLFRFEMSHAF